MCLGGLLHYGPRTKQFIREGTIVDLFYFIQYIYKLLYIFLLNISTDTCIRYH